MAVRHMEHKNTHPPPFRVEVKKGWKQKVKAQGRL
jgi:hypothetical protein